MIKLEITGDTVEQFYLEAMRSLAMLMQSQTTAQLAAEITTATTTDSNEPKRRGRPPKSANGPVEHVPESLEVSEPLAAEHNTSEPVSEKIYTATDCRDVARAIIARHTERGHDMPTCVEYVRKLFAPFGVQKASEIPEARRAEFIAAAQPYIEGKV